MKLYEMRDQGPYCRGFPYASGYGPLDGPMPFLVGELLEITLEFWKVNSMAPGLYIDKPGSKWGDFLMCGFAPPRTFISERVLMSLRGLKCTILNETEFPIAEILSKKLRDIPHPRYFAPQFEGGIDMDWHAMGVNQSPDGKPIIPDPGRIPPPIAKLSSWNGDDLFCWSNWDVTRLTMLCTEKVVELAKKEKWTNVRFDPVPTN